MTRKREPLDLLARKLARVPAVAGRQRTIAGMTPATILDEPSEDRRASRQVIPSAGGSGSLCTDRDAPKRKDLP